MLYGFTTHMRLCPIPILIHVSECSVQLGLEPLRPLCGHELDCTWSQRSTLCTQFASQTNIHKQLILCTLLCMYVTYWYTYTVKNTMLRTEWIPILLFAPCSFAPCTLCSFSSFMALCCVEYECTNCFFFPYILSHWVCHVRYKCLLHAIVDCFLFI